MSASVDPSLEYAAYSRVREAVLSLKATDRPASEIVEPSDYWQEELANFEYMLEASPLLISKLRHHCYHVTGLKAYEYQKISQSRLSTFHARARELTREADSSLLVPESPILGGFGYEIEGKLYNVDTLKYFEVLAGLDRARVLDRKFRGANCRRLVWEVGGGWGGLAYQFKTLFPDVTYVITDFPELFLFSAVYLLTAFPGAKVHIAGETAPEECLQNWREADFVFLPQSRPELIRKVRPDLLLNTVSFQEMTTAQVDTYLKTATSVQCPFVYSYNRDCSLYNEQLTNVRERLGEYYQTVELPRLGADYTAAVKGSPVGPRDRRYLKILENSGGYRHVVGYLASNAEGPGIRCELENLPVPKVAAGNRPQRPRVALGMTVYNGESFIKQAITSVLTQTYEDFILVIVDDGSTDGSADVVKDVAETDSRVVFHQNKRRTGMVAAWRRAFKLAQVESHKAEYFAWVSDHDIWHSKWLETMVQELDQDQKLSLVYPLTQFVDNQGELVYKHVPLSSNHGISNVEARFRYTTRNLRGSGNMVYGLFRRQALQRANVFRPTLLPDRLLMIELSLHGQIKQVFSSYWYRRQLAESTLVRQKENLFTKSELPRAAQLPWPLAFVYLLFTEYVINRDKARDLSKRGVGTWKFLRLLGVLYRDQIAVIRDKKRIQGRKLIRAQRRADQEIAAQLPE